MRFSRSRRRQHLEGDRPVVEAGSSCVIWTQKTPPPAWRTAAASRLTAGTMSRAAGTTACPTASFMKAFCRSMTTSAVRAGSSSAKQCSRAAALDDAADDLVGDGGAVEFHLFPLFRAMRFASLMILRERGTSALTASRGRGSGAGWLPEQMPICPSAPAVT